jgi:hypothetical protein
MLHPLRTPRRRGIDVRDTTAPVLIKVSQRPNGADVAEAVVSGRRFVAVSRNGATMALARQLVAAGVGDRPWQARGAEGPRRFFGSSLHRLSRLTIADNDDDGLRVRRFTPRMLPVGAAQDGVEASAGIRTAEARWLGCRNAGAGLTNGGLTARAPNHSTRLLPRARGGGNY